MHKTYRGGWHYDSKASVLRLEGTQMRNDLAAIKRWGMWSTKNKNPHAVKSPEIWHQTLSLIII